MKFLLLLICLGHLSLATAHEFLLQLEPKAPGQKLSEADQVMVRRKLANRLDRLDFIAKASTSLSSDFKKAQIRVKLGTELSLDEARAALKRVLGSESLALRAVHPDNRELVAAYHLKVPGYERFVYKHTDDAGNEFIEVLWLDKSTPLTKEDVAEASVDPTSRDRVMVRLNEAGARKMREFTSTLRLGRDRIAVLYDGEVKVAPVVMAILSRQFEISGLKAPGEAAAVADSLNTSFPCRVKLISD